MIKQLSVFIENRAGRMEQVTSILQRNGINITSLSLADTTEFGMLRMIVTKPEEAKNMLKEEGISAMLTDVLAVRLPNKPGVLHQFLTEMKGINIEYMYVLSTKEDGAMILKVSDMEKTMEALENGSFTLIGEEAYQING